MSAHLSEAEYAALVPGSKVAKRSKYGAKAAVITDDGMLITAKAAKAEAITGRRYDSIAEARRYLELVALQKAGVIRDIKTQPAFAIHAADAARTTCAVYRADFDYIECTTGERVIEDVKGCATAAYRLKKKLVEAEYGLRIVEVRA